MYRIYLVKSLDVDASGLFYYHTGVYDEIEDQVIRAIEKVDFDKLTQWVDWVGGDDTAANFLNE